MKKSFVSLALFATLWVAATSLASRKIYSESLPSICQDSKGLLSLETESEEREMQTRLLGKCPKKSDIARLLEKRILDDDSFVRAAAWKSLGKHADTKSKDFLIKIYFQEDLKIKEKELLYLYLSRLAGPTDQKRALPIFLRGLVSHSRIIRHASLVGLGAIRAPRAFSIFQKILTKKNASPSELLTALEGLRRLKSNRSLSLAKSLALHSNPAVQRKAIELLAERPSRLYKEAILEIYLQGPHPQNQGLLFQKAHSILEGLKKENPTRQILYTTKKTLLYKKPNHRSAIIASLGKYTILYSNKKSTFYYRKKAPKQNQDLSGRYLFVESSQGLSGWVHESEVRFF